MLNFPCFQQYKKVFLFLSLIALPLLSAAQDCPPPADALVIYDPYEDASQAFVDWFTPSAECDILGYEIQYAFNDFIPGTGAALDSIIVSGPTAAIYVSGSVNGLHVYIRTICAAPCGLMGDGDGNGNGASGWVLAEIFIVPPPPPPCPGVDYEGNCSDPLEPGAMEDGCFPLSALHFYGHCVQFNESVNPCTDEEEFMIWYQYDSPPTGELIFSGDIQDLSGTVTPPESFGIVVLDQNCNGNILDCDSTLTENDSLVVSLPPGETFFVGFWLNDAEYVIDPWEGDFSNYDLYLSVCEPEQDCAYPTDISISDITNQSIEIEWDDSEGTSWMLEYGPPGFTPGTGTEVLIDTGSPFLLEGLQPDTEYDFYMETICAQFDANSINIGPTNFSTYSSIIIDEVIPNGQAFCCDDLLLPESVEAEAFCDSVYFTHSDSLVGDACPYTIYRTITVHDTCGNSVDTSFHYDIVDNGIPCGCESEFAIPNNEVGDAVALYGNWAVIERGMDEIYYYEDGEWSLFQSIQLGSNDRETLDIYEDVIVSRNKVYRLSDGEWLLETTLDDSEFSSAYELVSIHENTIALSVLDQINIYEYIDGEWALVTSFNQNASSLDLDENKLILGVNSSDVIGHIYHKSGDDWSFEQELTTFGDFDDFYSNYGVYDVAIDGNHAAVGYQVGGYLFTYFYDGEQWVQEELLTNPYREGSPNGYFSFGNAVDIDNGVMVVGDYRNAGFTGSIVVFDRACGSWVPQREIWSIDGAYHQRFGASLSLHNSKLVVGVNTNTYYINQSIPYEGEGKYWFYECLENSSTYSIATNNEVNVECLEDVPPAELAYELGNAWCSSTEVSIETDTLGTDCDLTITRVFTATDSLGNTASATQQISVLDTEPPVVVSEPEDLSLLCTDDWVDETPEFIDNCSIELEITYARDTVFNDGCEILIEEIWQATDGCENTTTVVRSVSIQDETPPTITCPDDIEVLLTTDGETYNLADFTTDVDVSDNCAEDVSISQSIDPGTELIAGEHTVTLTASDGCHTATCDISVEVIVTTSIDNQEGQHVVIYPNPSDGMVSIQRNDSSPLQVEVFDVHGKLIFSESFNAQNFELDLHHVAKGTYTVRLQSTTYSVVEQIIIR